MDLTIERENSADGGRYVARSGANEAELTFTRRGPGLVSADHTGVPDAMGGQGVGRALIDAMRADAAKEGFKIEPRCAYVRAQYARHPEWAPVFATKPGEAPA